MCEPYLEKSSKDSNKRGREDRSCNGTAKETKVNHYENSTVDIFTIF